LKPADRPGSPVSDKIDQKVADQLAVLRAALADEAAKETPATENTGDGR